VRVNLIVRSCAVSFVCNVDVRVLCVRYTACVCDEATTKLGDRYVCACVLYVCVCLRCVIAHSH
jgi:hypothetical protein